MNKLILVIALLACQLAGCAITGSNKDSKQQTRVFVDEHNTLNYIGSINEETNNRLFELYTQLDSKPTALKISSLGGNVTAGIELGHWVFDQQLEVIIDQVCASSCANYVFPAGKKKYLYRHSALIWHGNSYQDNFDKLYQAGNTFAIDIRNKENAFYQKIQVHPMLAEYGHKEFTLWNRLYHFLRDTVGYDYSISDMEKFGLTNIILLDGVWEWRKHYRQHHVIRVEVEADELAPFPP